jgi:hypothetical protein
LTIAPASHVIAGHATTAACRSAAPVKAVFTLALQGRPAFFMTGGWIMSIGGVSASASASFAQQLQKPAQGGAPQPTAKPRQDHDGDETGQTPAINAGSSSGSGGGSPTSLNTVA